MLKEIEESTAFIRKEVDAKPRVGIILGTGLKGLTKEIDIRHTLSYTDIPYFPESTVESHAGKLVFGKLGGQEVVAMQGRFHYYEGYDLRQITFPVRVMKHLGIQTLFVSNACGSVNPEMLAGDLMIIEDHINMLPDNPLRGKNDEAMGPRFPDMSEPYSRELIAQAEKIATELDISVKKGVYTVVQGPNLETAAEYQWLRIIGSDVVGMSTVPEVIVAQHMGIPCFAVSVITDEGFHRPLPKVTVEDVIAVATQAEPHMTRLMRELIARQP